MPRKLFLCIACVLIIAVASGFAVRAYTEHQFRVVYSLDARKNDQEIISLINNAHSYVYFAIYTFTKSNIADALVKAKKRGLKVEGIVDASAAKEDYEKPIITELIGAGIPLETQVHSDGIMHIKAVVTDAGYASGSYNWTASATDSNDEFLEVGTNGYMHDQYLALLQKILAANKSGTISAMSMEGKGDATAITGTYDYTDAKNHIGEHATVTGRVVKVYKSKSGTVFFDYCTAYKKCPFGAIVFSSAAGNFDDITKYRGKIITITGDIKSYQGATEIVIDKQSQISTNTGN